TTASTGSGAITFTGAVNGGFGVTANSGGATTFSAAVGGTTPLTSLTTDATGTTSLVNVTTSGAQAYGDNVTLNGTYTTTNNAFKIGRASSREGEKTAATGSGAITYTGAGNSGFGVTRERG